MNYCKRCKIAAKETDTVCSRCGSAVSTFGASKSSSVGPARASVGQAIPPAASPAKSSPDGPSRPPLRQAPYALGGEVRRLEQIERANVRRARGLGLLSVLVALAILFIAYQAYSRTVLAFAVIENVEFAQDPVAENQLTISFDVKSPGQVSFDRRSGRGHTEKIDLIATTGVHKTVWAWPSDPKTGIDVNILYRSGWFRASQRRHFQVTRDGIGVDVVFLVDTTSSMANFIEILKKQCLDFADEVTRRGLDCRLALIGFGDVDYNEPILVFQAATPDKFRENVASLELTSGGDAPESGVEALEKALEAEYRPHTRVCFVHVTDEACKNRDRIPALAAALKRRSIVTNVVSQNRLRPLYKPLCVNGGSFYDLRDSSFGAILKVIARSIANTIKSN